MAQRTRKKYHYRVRTHLMTDKEQSMWLQVEAPDDLTAMRSIAFRHSRNGTQVFTLLDFEVDVCEDEDVVLEFDVGPQDIRSVEHVIILFDWSDEGYLLAPTRQRKRSGQHQTDWCKPTQTSELARTKKKEVESGPTPKTQPKRQFMKEVITL